MSKNDEKKQVLKSADEKFKEDFMHRLSSHTGGELRDSLEDFLQLINTSRIADPDYSDLRTDCSIVLYDWLGKS